MSGFRRPRSGGNGGNLLLASRYDDPRGGRPTALEHNVLRYRAIEAVVYIYYAEEIKRFMLDNVEPLVTNKEDNVSISNENERLRAVQIGLISDAVKLGKISEDDGKKICSLIICDKNKNSGKKLKRAFRGAVKLGFLSESESISIQELLDYRNDIAHEVHLVLADVSRIAAVGDMLSSREPSYKSEALGRLRHYHRLLWSRSSRLPSCLLSFNGLMFEHAQRVYEAELCRLDRLIRKQIEQERRRTEALKTELDLQGTELVGDLHPRFIKNFRWPTSWGDDYAPPSGHLTSRGVEICYRLYDLGKSPLAVAYLMGITLRSAQRRYKSWEKAGGKMRVKSTIQRYRLLG